MAPDLGLLASLMFTFLLHLNHIERTLAQMSCPKQCSCLGSYVDCSKRLLTNVPLDIPIWVETLDLQHNRIDSIEHENFKHLPSLKRVILSHNHFITVNLRAFKSNRQLTSLVLSHNSIEQFPLIDQIPQLRILDLSDNQLLPITDSLISFDYGQLLQLDLNFNKLKKFPRALFTQQSHLTHLFLSGNGLDVIQKDDLSNITHLLELKLNKNKLYEIPKGLFKNLSSLQVLDLARNKITHIEGLTFNGLDSLRTLNLRFNNINQLFDGAFYGLTSIQRLHLDHNSIETVDKGWLYGLATLHHLFLSHNKIDTILESAWEFCKELIALDLQNNNLKHIGEQDFLSLGTLKRLFLDHNQLSLIDDGAFEGLRSLVRLEMNHNFLFATIEDTNGPFRPMENLQNLGLSRNHIKSIPKKAFNGLPNLINLDLSHNPISFIKENAFIYLKSLQTLKFSSRNMVCDCHIRWFRNWLLQIKNISVEEAKCSHPERLFRADLMAVEPENLNCVGFPKPFIQTHPITQNVLKGSNLTLECVASSSGNLSTFHWRKDKQNYDGGIITNIATVLDNGLTQFVSHLLIHNVTDNHQGRYQCVISNQFASVYSQKAKITVQVFPYFIKEPMDVVARIGSTVKLECGATGHPFPEISWKKDGGDDFPAARERRMHVMPSDDVFFIVGLKHADQGVYSCMAQNAAGIAVTNATLTAIESTQLTLKPSGAKEARVGESVALECQPSLNGIAPPPTTPSPKVTWTKDSQILVASERHFFTAENQILVIIHSQTMDSGRYSCSLQNEVEEVIHQETTSLIVLPVDNLIEQGHTIGMIIIAVVICVVGTSMIWLLVIYYFRYKCRRKTKPRNRTACQSKLLPKQPILPITREETVCLYVESDHSSKCGDQDSQDGSSRSTVINQYSSFTGSLGSLPSGNPPHEATWSKSLSSSHLHLADTNFLKLPSESQTDSGSFSIESGKLYNVVIHT